MRALAAAADALDLAVERRVFLAQRVVRVVQILLAGHVADARLAMTDRRLDHPSAAASASAATRILRNRRRPLRERVCPADQNHQRHREDCFSHVGSPVLLFLPIAPAHRSLRSYGVPGRRSPAPFVHRPWWRATRFRRPPPRRRSRTSRRFRCRNGLHLPAAPDSPRPPPPSQVTALADRGERRRNNRRYDTAFPRIDHIPRNLDATNNSGQSAPFRG